MNKQTFSNIARGAMTGLSLIVSAMTIVDFTSEMVNKYQSRKSAGSGSANE